MKSLTPDIIGNELIDSWNRYGEMEQHTLYDDNVEFICSLANRLIHDTRGKLRGKKTLMAYWQLMHSRYPNLKMIHLGSSWYKDKILVHFSIPPLSNKAYGIISFNKEKKITHLKLSHV